MGKYILDIEELCASTEDGKEILGGLDLRMKPGETHVIMGPNGAGKSTLAHVIMGHPDYQVTAGRIRFEDEEITDSKTDERARKGIFLSFQSPQEVDGITVEDFLRTSKSAVTGANQGLVKFRKELSNAMTALDFDPAYGRRYLNVGFSGGEKKKNEILQMLMLQPKLAILDETDSGLDVDAVKTVTQGVQDYKTQENALLIISHSTKLLDDLEVDCVHILVDGTIRHTGDRTLIHTINREGFARFTEHAAEV